MITRKYPAHGWLPAGAHFELKWDDQGRDLATNWNGVVQAPGDGEVIAVLEDVPFPNGFGPAYPVVRVTSGAWAGHDYYLGHTTSRVRAGQRFSFGHVLSHANQGHDWAGTHGGWVELGETFNGLPGPKEGHHWFDKLIETPLVLKFPEPELRYGMKGPRILALSSRLRDCGYVGRPYWHFNSKVHWAVVAFKTHHHIRMPPLQKGGRAQTDRGIVTEHTNVAIAHAAHWCKKTHHKEYPPHK